MKPLDTALSKAMVKVIVPPSSTLASEMVTAALSSLLIVPVPVSVVSSKSSMERGRERSSDTVKPTVKVSLLSITSSWVVCTVKVLVSPAVPAKVTAFVLAV